MLLDALDLGDADTVLDLGCGWAELLTRAVQRTAQTVGIGVDNDPGAMQRARVSVRQRALVERVTLVEQPAGAWAESADRVLCVGSGHIWGATEEALQALSGVVLPGGRLLYGDGYLHPAPSPFTTQLFKEMLPLSGVLDAVRGAGWRVLHLSVSDQLEWDEFESTFRAGPEQWLLANPHVSTADQIRAWLDRRLHEYVDGYRGEVGFCWLVLTR